MSIAREQCLGMARELAGQLTAEQHAEIARAWPADWPPPAVLAQVLAAMLAQALPAARAASPGFLRQPPSPAWPSPRPPK